MRKIIEVIMKDVDFGDDTITVDVSEWDSVGAGRYRLVPIPDDEDNVIAGAYGEWGALAKKIYDQQGVDA